MKVIINKKKEIQNDEKLGSRAKHLKYRDLTFDVIIILILSYN